MRGTAEGRTAVLPGTCARTSRAQRLLAKRPADSAADDERDVRAEHVRRAESVERPDDLDLQVLREAHGLRLVAAPVHHEGAREVASGRVADGADRVAEPAHR